MGEWEMCRMQTNGNDGGLCTHWYAVKVFYNRVFLLESALQQEGFGCYVPCRKIETEDEHGQVIVRREQLIPSLLFFRSNPRQAREIQRRYADRIFLYTEKDAERLSRPAPIPDHEMQIFILVTSAGDRGLKDVTKEISGYKVGQKVRITGGMFKGVEGYIQRIKHNRRLLVAIKGVCVVATSYIEPAYIERIEDSK